MDLESFYLGEIGLFSLSKMKSNTLEIEVMAKKFLFGGNSETLVLDWQKEFFSKKSIFHIAVSG